MKRNVQTSGATCPSPLDIRAPGGRREADGASAFGGGSRPNSKNCEIQSLYNRGRFVPGAYFMLDFRQRDKKNFTLFFRWGMYSYSVHVGLPGDAARSAPGRVSTGSRTYFTVALSSRAPRRATGGGRGRRPIRSDQQAAV